ncbi:MAG TPA: acyltransferase [Hyphomicrobiaceae bacterium]|nr:acyltransferase [Hyphomicrobiaceae bacterium]
MSYDSRSREPATAHLPFLDIVRTMAAMLVVLGHVRWFYFVGIADVPEPGLLTKAFYLLTGLQHEGVVLFFVVSGFLVGGALYESMAFGSFDARRYLTHRFVRIYLVFVPAVLLAAVLEEIARVGLADTRVYRLIKIEPWTAFDTVCHIACLQGVFCGTSRNGPLWSLAYEWILYLVAPLILAPLFASISRPMRIIAVAIVVATIFMVLPAHMQWSFFVFWAMGIVAHRLLSHDNVPVWLGLAGLALVMVALLASRAKIAPPLLTSCLIAAGLSMAIACRRVVTWSPAPRSFAALAAFSYSLYATHLPVGKFTAQALERAGLVEQLAPPGVAVFAAFAITVSISLIVAAAFARLTEARTSAVRRALLVLQ